SKVFCCPRWPLLQRIPKISNIMKTPPAKIPTTAPTDAGDVTGDVTGSGGGTKSAGRRVGLLE
ncbi:unnamed protein product, partial [Prunus brigantina]